MNKKLRNGLSWRGEPLENIRARHNARCFNFVSESLQHSDDLKVLGFEDENIIWMHDKFTWANIASQIGLFASTTIAKGSGWNVALESGFAEAFFSRSDGTPLFVFILK